MLEVKCQLVTNALISDHTLALIKNREGMALFDPCEGMAQIPSKDQTESFNQLLDYYGYNGSVSMKVIQLHKRLKQTDQSEQISTIQL